MTLPASGSISLTAIRDEFKAASGSVSMSELYRSGTYVPPLTANASIPTSGSITLQNFYSATISTDMDASYAAESLGVKGSGSNCTVTIYTNASLSSSASPTTVTSFSDTWVAASADPGAWYEVYVSVTSGTSPSGASLNTWLDLSTNRAWTIYSPNGCVLSLKVRHKYITSSEETTSITLTATA